MPAGDWRYLAGMAQPTPMRRLVFTVVVLLFFAYAGRARGANGWSCALAEKSCASVFVVHNSWHAAIVLPMEHLNRALPELGDFPDARFIEFSWGDKDYFPDPNSGFFLGLKAAFWSRGSVLHLVGFTEPVGGFYPGAKVTELRLSAAALERLIGHISQSFSRRRGERAKASAGLYSYSRFYPSTGKFSVLNTCNTWVARALEAAGLPVAPASVISAGQLSDQLDTIAVPR